jgi:UDP-galactopyranose mutase
MLYDTVVVGAGFAGATMARLLTDAGQRVLVIDRRPHVAGNAYDEIDKHGILVHRFGAHIFHTNSPKVVDFLSRFTGWRPYRHQVMARVDDKIVPIPINRTTINALFDLSLQTDEEAEWWLEEHREPVRDVQTSEDVVVSRVGRVLYEKLFRGYTLKQWERDPSELDRSVCARIPVRTNDDPFYFADRFQNMPKLGYTTMFHRMLLGIDVRLGTAWDDLTDVVYGHVVWTGPIDEFFEHALGRLPYRSLRFRHVNYPTRDLMQPVAVVNEPDPARDWTRTIEHRHLTGQFALSTTVSFEHPARNGEPYYPVPTDASQALYQRYRAMAEEVPTVTFVGRLARYQYLDMDQVVAQALATFERMNLPNIPTSVI